MGLDFGASIVLGLRASELPEELRPVVDEDEDADEKFTLPVQMLEKGIGVHNEDVMCGSTDNLMVGWFISSVVCDSEGDDEEELPLSFLQDRAESILWFTRFVGKPPKLFFFSTVSLADGRRASRATPVVQYSCLEVRT